MLTHFMRNSVAGYAKHTKLDFYLLITHESFRYVRKSPPPVHDQLSQFSFNLDQCDQYAKAYNKSDQE